MPCTGRWNISMPSATVSPRAAARVTSSRTIASWAQWWCGFGCSSPTHTARASARRCHAAASSSWWPVRASTSRLGKAARSRSIGPGSATAGLAGAAGPAAW
jgi:hypothetical protein